MCISCGRPISHALMRRWGDLLHRAWTLKRSISSSVSLPAIDALYEKARDAGAYGGKIIGAGGGGFLLVIAPPERRAESTPRWAACIGSRCGWNGMAAMWFM